MRAREAPYLSSPVPPRALISTSDHKELGDTYHMKSAFPVWSKEQVRIDLDQMESNQHECMYCKYMGNDVSTTQKSHCMDNFYQHIYALNHPVLEHTVNSGMFKLSGTGEFIQ